MNKKLLLTLVSVVLAVCFSMTAATAKKPLFSGFVNGIERKVYEKEDQLYLKIGKEEELMIGASDDKIIVDVYGAIWKIVEDGQDTIMWYCPEIMAASNMDIGMGVFFLGYDAKVESFIDEGPEMKEVGVGYKTHDGKTHDFPDFKAMCRMMGVEEGSIPEPKYIPASPTPNPTSSPTSFKIIREKSRTSLYEGDKLVSKIALKKGILTWERKGKKTKKYTNVKEAAFIKRSKNLTIVYKTGAAEVRSFKNATKKRIVDKGAKKILYFEDCAVAIKTAAKKVNIRNK